MKVNDAVHDAGSDPIDPANSCLNDAPHDLGSDKLDIAKKCLTLICDIAGRGVRSQDPDHVGYALQELSQVLVERTGTDEILPPSQMTDLARLLEELDWVDSGSQGLEASARNPRAERVAPPSGTCPVPESGLSPAP